MFPALVVAPQGSRSQPGLDFRAHARSSGEFVSPRRPCVLVVEDDQDLRTTLLSLLEEEGFEAHAGGNGEEAFALLEAGLSPSIILLDLAMPVMDGWAFMARLRELPRFATTPVATMSAGRNLARAPVSAAYLEKPIQREALLETLARLAA